VGDDEDSRAAFMRDFGEQFHHLLATMVAVAVAGESFF
jgi:hypothetical protein